MIINFKFKINLTILQHFPAALYFMWKSQDVCKCNSMGRGSATFSFQNTLHSFLPILLTVLSYHPHERFYSHTLNIFSSFSTLSLFHPHALLSIVVLFSIIHCCEVVIKLLSEFEWKTFCSIDSKSFCYVCIFLCNFTLCILQMKQKKSYYYCLNTKLFFLLFCVKL